MVKPLILTVTLVTMICASVWSAPWDTGSYYPAWQNVVPTVAITHLYDGGKTSEQNGADLATAIENLAAGEKLVIKGGTYSINKWFNIEIQGTAVNPIWITAAAGETVIITRPDNGQNVINVGSGATTQYVCFRGLEITGGASLLRLYNCVQVWVDQCYIHNGDGVGITANSADTDYLFITGNHIHDPGSATETSEGMYLGANNSTYRMTNSTIALNYVHDCGGTQGDGIEVKQGSYDNWIVENEVHDTNYPCILVYGTDGLGVNLVERNIIYRSGDNTMQIQGEAVVRNNLVISGGGSAFASQFHQAEPTGLTVVHNTFINSGTAARLSSWDSKAGMVFANNACYSESSNAIQIAGGGTGVSFAGNITLGTLSGVSTGYTAGNGLSDFILLNYTGTNRDARPTELSALRNSGDPLYAAGEDLDRSVRDFELESGAYEYDALPGGGNDPGKETGCGGGCSPGGAAIWPAFLIMLWFISRKINKIKRT